MAESLKTVNGHLSCVRVTPTEDTSKKINNLKTIAMLLTKKQATALGIALIQGAAVDELNTVIVTGWRKPARNGEYHVTVTGRRGITKRRGLRSPDEEEFAV